MDPRRAAPRRLLSSHNRIRLGSLKKVPVPAIQVTQGINWVKPGKWITILGFPFGESPDLDAFWEAKYFKCKLLAYC